MSFAAGDTAVWQPFVLLQKLLNIGMMLAPNDTTAGNGCCEGGSTITALSLEQENNKAVAAPIQRATTDFIFLVGFFNLHFVMKHGLDVFYQGVSQRARTGRNS